MRSKCNNIGKYLAKCLAHRRVWKMIVHLSSLKFYKLVRKNRHILSVSWKGVLKLCYPGVLKMDSAVQTHGNSKYKTNQAKVLWLKLCGSLKPGMLKWPTPLYVLLCAPHSSPLTPPQNWRAPWNTDRKPPPTPVFILQMRKMRFREK